jgi:hypothetical protein
VYASIVELGAESHTKNPYVAEMYKLALERKPYSGSISWVFTQSQELIAYQQIPGSQDQTIFPFQ